MIQVYLIERAELLRQLKKLESSIYNNSHTRTKVREINSRIKKVEKKIEEVISNES